MAKHKQSKKRTGSGTKGVHAGQRDPVATPDVEVIETDLPHPKAVAHGETKQPRTSDLKPAAKAAASWRPYFAIIPSALALLASINTLWNGFAADDLQQILNNPSIKKLANIPLVFTTSVWAFATNDIIFASDSYYRPMFNMLFTVNYALSGNQAWGWHLINALIHAAVAYLVFLVVSAVTSRQWVAVTAASLFAVHPAHAESIAWISGVTDPLMALFILPAFLCYWRFRQTGRRLFLIGMLVLYLGGMLCKETAVAFPVVVAFCELALPSAPANFGKRLRKVLILAALFTIPTALYFLMRVNALSRVLFGSDPRNPLKPVLETAPLAVAKYLKLSLIPYGYSYQHYTRLAGSLFDVRFLGPALLIVVIVGAIVWLRSREIAFAAVWFVLWLAPALAAMRQFELEYMVQERYLYLPSIGLCMALALLLEWVSKRGAIGLLSARVLAIALIVVFAAVLIVQNRVWKDSVSVMRNCVAEEPWSVASHAGLAAYLSQAGLQREAETEANKVVTMDPLFFDGYLSLSSIDFSTGRLDKAISDLERGVQEADSAGAGSAQAASGGAASGEAASGGAASGEAASGGAASGGVGSERVNTYKLGTMLLNLGFLYERKKEPALAEQTLLRSLQVWPRPVGWYKVGQFYVDQGNYTAARDLFEKVRASVPNRFAAIHLKLGVVYEKLGDISRARSEYQLYVDLGPDGAERREIERRLAGM